MAWGEKRNSGGVASHRSHPRATPQTVSALRIEVSVVTDSRLAAEALLWSLGQLRDIHPVAAVATNPAASAVAHADVVLVDADVADSVRVADALGHAHPEATLIVANLSPCDGRIADFVMRGVTGFVLRDAPLHELARTIRKVAGGATVLPDALTESLFSRVRNCAQSAGAAADHVRPHFTRREWEVIDLVCAGLKTGVIGARLNISRHTVSSHVCNILAKLALHSRLELAAWAHREHGTA